MKIYLRNIALFSVFVVGGHIAYYEAIGHQKNPWEIVAFDALLEEDVEVVYLGDSTTIDIDKEDSDTRNLPTMVNDELAGHYVAAHSFAAYHGEVFEGYCRRIAKAENKPEAVIIPISMRSFSPAWDSKPEWQFEKEKFILKYNSYWAEALLVPLSVFRFVDLVPVDQNSYEAMPVYFGEERAGIVGDYVNPIVDETDDEHFRKQFVLSYGYRLEKENRKLDALRNSAEHLNEAGVVPIFYIVPLDFESGERWVGQKFSDQLEHNVQSVIEQFELLGIEVLDLSATVGSDSFDYDWEVHEHIDEGGRRYVAEALSKKVRVALSKR